MGNSINRLGNGYSQNRQPFINKNQDTLNKLSEQNNQLLFNNKRLGKPLTIVQQNNEELQSSSSDGSDSSYNKQFSNIQKIIFDGADITVNPYNQKQIIVHINNIEDYIDEQQNIITDYYNIKQINNSEYNASNKDFLICNIQSGGSVIKMPKNPQNKSYIKIATLENINSNNKIILTVSQPNYFIHQNNNLTLQIDTPFSSIQLIYSSAYRIWRVITPFVPMQKSTVGLTQSQVKKMTKRYLNIFG